MRRMSPNGRAKLRQWEGVKYVAYRDSGGIWTNGVGHTGPDVFEGQTVDEEQVEAWLDADLVTAEMAVNRHVKVALTQNQFDALVSFVFNVGVSAFAKSTLLKVLNAGRYEEVPAQLARWNKVGKKVNRGLSNRRAAEAGLWAAGEFVASAHVVPSASGKPMRQSKTMQGAAMTSVATLGSMATETAADVQMVADYSEALRWAFVVLLFLGIGLTIYGRWRISKDEGI